MMSEPYAVNGFICVTDMDGCRHAIRLTSISGLSDASIDRTEAIIVANGGRTSVMVPNSLDSLLEDVLQPQPGGPRQR